MRKVESKTDSCVVDEDDVTMEDYRDEWSPVDLLAICTQVD